MPPGPPFPPQASPQLSDARASWARSADSDTSPLLHPDDAESMPSRRTRSQSPASPPSAGPGSESGSAFGARTASRASVSSVGGHAPQSPVSVPSTTLSAAPTPRSSAGVKKAPATPAPPRAAPPASRTRPRTAPENRPAAAARDREAPPPEAAPQPTPTSVAPTTTAGASPGPSGTASDGPGAAGTASAPLDDGAGSPVGSLDRRLRPKSAPVAKPGAGAPPRGARGSVSKWPDTARVRALRASGPPAVTLTHASAALHGEAAACYFAKVVVYDGRGQRIVHSLPATPRATVFPAWDTRVHCQMSVPHAMLLRLTVFHTDNGAEREVCSFELPLTAMQGDQPGVFTVEAKGSQRDPPPRVTFSFNGAAPQVMTETEKKLVKVGQQEGLERQVCARCARWACVLGRQTTYCMPVSGARVCGAL